MCFCVLCAGGRFLLRSLHVRRTFLARLLSFVSVCVAYVGCDGTHRTAIHSTTLDITLDIGTYETAIHNTTTFDMVCRIRT